MSNRFWSPVYCIVGGQCSSALALQTGLLMYVQASRPSVRTTGVTSADVREPNGWKKQAIAKLLDVMAAAGDACEFSAELQACQSAEDVGMAGSMHHTYIPLQAPVLVNISWHRLGCLAPVRPHAGSCGTQCVNGVPYKHQSWSTMLASTGGLGACATTCWVMWDTVRLGVGWWAAWSGPSVLS